MHGWPTVALVAVLTVVQLLSGCDFGPWAAPSTGTEATSTEIDTGPDPRDYRGPRVLSVWPQPGASDIPRDAVIRLRLSGHLDPGSVTSGAFTLRSGPVRRWISTSYDPVDRELRIWSSPALTRKVEWVLVILEGLRGLDGEMVLPGEVTRFRTNDETTEQPPIASPSYEREIAPILSRSCQACHNADSKIAGLVLDSPQGIAATAVETRSDGWPSFVRIEPERPDSSYLIYKIIGWKDISGQPMPSALVGSAPTALTKDEQRLLSHWIGVGLPFVDPQDTDS